jgi:hypothetical protein
MANIYDIPGIEGLLKSSNTTMGNLYNVARGSGLHEQAMREYLDPFTGGQTYQISEGPVAEYMSNYLKDYTKPDNKAAQALSKGRGPDQMRVVGLGESPNPFSVSGIAKAAEMSKNPSFQAENLFGEGTLTKVPGGYDYTGGKFDFAANNPVTNFLQDKVFKPSEYVMKFDENFKPLETFNRDFRNFEKARMGAELTARGVNPEVISQIDKLTADEEGALLDDAFENQLAIATRTGSMGPIEGIMKALNPKNIAGFITDSLPLTLASQGLSSIADRLGIRTGMQEPLGAVGRGGYGVSRPGNTLTNQTRANRAQFSDFYSNFQGGAQHHMGKRVDDVISRTGSGRRTRSDAQKFVNTYGSEEQKKNFQAAKEQNRRDRLTEQFKSEEGDTGGSSKIVCTMMNKSYGFGSFRNKIWMKFHKDLSPEYQKGYHRIFLPLVKIAKKNKIVRKILEHIAVHSTIDMRQSMRGKKHLLGRLYRKIILPICYWAGKK